MAITTPRLPDAPALDFAPIERPRLLIVDDQPVNIHALFSIFVDDCELFMATSGEQALLQCRDTPPDLVLLDVVMGGMDGLAVCRAIKADPELQGIPVIFVTGQNNPEEEAACWDAGAVDFITKPINPRTVRNRVRAHLTLKHQSDLLRRLATVDGLTGLANRRQFDERLEREWQRTRRVGAPLAAVLLDIDHFKGFNDTYGHLAGDDCLRGVAATLRAASRRSSDLTARTGGEEFCCVLPEADLDGALEVAHAIAEGLRARAIAHAGSPHGVVTASIGVTACRPADGGSPLALLQRADELLYRAKHEGRARIVADGCG